MNRSRVVKTSQCARCFFRFTGRLVCVAFPTGIPAAISQGRFDHTLPYTGDGGVRFIARKEVRRLTQPAAPRVREDEMIVSGDVIAAALRELTPRERRILWSRFGTGEQTPPSTRATRPRPRDGQIAKRAIRKLRAAAS